jgi:Holliday junction resolvasome RuvABC endonuclease subunit
VRIIAFDLSLSCTGWADAEECGVLIPPSVHARGIDRLRWIRDAVLERAYGNGLAVLEGYSFASKGRAIISLGELGGVVRCALADAGIPSIDVAPASRALFATGKGNASKEHVLTEAVRVFGYPGHSNDEADALWLRQMALDFYAAPAPALTATKRKALAAVTWPDLGVSLEVPA